MTAQQIIDILSTVPPEQDIEIYSSTGGKKFTEWIDIESDDEGGIASVTIE